MKPAMLALQPGLHPGVGHDEYHSDPAARHSLTASVAHLLINRSARHAWAAHPRLGNQAEWSASEEMDEGSVLHSMMAGSGSPYAILDYDSFRTKAAQEARAEARARGLIPIKSARHSELQTIAAKLREQISKKEPFRENGGAEMLRHGASEATMVWETDGVWCRARPDWISDDRSIIVDWKFTTKPPTPERWPASAIADGHDMRAAFYQGGTFALFGKRARYLFVVTEVSPPYEMAVYEWDDEALNMGHSKVAEAVAMWRKCFTKDEWPGYPDFIFSCAAPQWALNAWEMRLLLQAANTGQQYVPRMRRGAPALEGS